MNMDEVTDEEACGGGSVPPRWSFWKVGLALLGLVVILLGAAFVLNARLRPPVGVEPIAKTIANPAVPAVAASPSVINTALVATTTASTVPATPTTNATPELLPGVRVASTPLEHEIETAYLHYWTVRSDAFLNLDTSHLGDVMAGPELTRDTKQIEDLKAQGKAVKVDVIHHIALLRVSSTAAEVYDEYLNRSVYVNPMTKQVLPTNAPPETDKVSYQMEKVDGTWKVIDGARHN